jgi:hypothetical protein
MSFPGSDFADRVEARLFRGWFDLDTWGDPVTWIHHALWALVFAGIGALIGWPFGLAALGAKIGALGSVAFYVVREGLALRRAWGSPGMWWRGKPHHTGWLVDGILDCVGPALVAWWLW